MIESVTPTAFYSAIQRDQLSQHAHQWSSLIYFGQERIPCSKALELVPRGSTCLDWGCGNGHFSVFLARHGYRVHAFALDEAPDLISGNPAIAFARGTDPVRLPYEDETFDAVFGVGVLEHVHELGGDETASLAELERILKPGGLLFIFHLPNSGSWIEWAKGVVGQLQHARRYTRDRFAAYLNGRSLSVIEQGRYHLLPRRALNRLPRMLRDSPTWCGMIDTIENVVSIPLRPICQNWYFILKKRAGAGPR